MGEETRFERLEFGELLEIVDCLKHDQVFDFKYFDPDLPLKVEYFDNVSFVNAKELVEWIPDNLDFINKRKIMFSMDDLLTETYFHGRLEDVNDVFLVIRETDAILVRSKVAKSVRIDCSDYDTYKRQMIEAIVNRSS